MKPDSKITIQIHGEAKTGKSTFAQTIISDLLDRGVTVSHNTETTVADDVLRKKLEAFKQNNCTVTVEEITQKNDTETLPDRVIDRVRNLKTVVKHSQSKSAWNVVGTIVGGKYKIARVPYVTDDNMPSKFNDSQKNEAHEIAQFISKCCNNSEEILKLID